MRKIIDIILCVLSSILIIIGYIIGAILIFGIIISILSAILLTGATIVVGLYSLISLLL